MSNNYRESWLCAHCGAQLTKTPIQVGRSHQNNERRYKIRAKCPNHRWWKPWHSTWFFGNPGGVQLFGERELWYDAVVPEVIK